MSHAFWGREGLLLARCVCIFLSVRDCLLREIFCVLASSWTRVDDRVVILRCFRFRSKLSAVFLLYAELSRDFCCMEIMKEMSLRQAGRWRLCRFSAILYFSALSNVFQTQYLTVWRILFVVDLTESITLFADKFRLIILTSN